MCGLHYVKFNGSRSQKSETGCHSNFPVSENVIFLLAKEFNAKSQDNNSCQFVII